MHSFEMLSPAFGKTHAARTIWGRSISRTWNRALTSGALPFARSSGRPRSRQEDFMAKSTAAAKATKSAKDPKKTNGSKGKGQGQQQGQQGADDATATLKRLQAKDPGVKQLLQKAHAYAVFHPVG